MPLWFLDGLHDKTVQSAMKSRLVNILAGTILGYIGIRIQDDVLDEPERTDPQMLLFGNTCFSGMIAAYGQALGAASLSFWNLFDRDFVDFSRFTLAEREVVTPGAPYSKAAFGEHAQKVAFAHTPLLAIAMLVGRADADPLIGKLVHQLGIAYGIVNDIVGWTRDLRAGHRTWLLASAGLTQQELLDVRALPDASSRHASLAKLEEQLRAALYEGQKIHDALKYSCEMQRLAEETANTLGLEGFARYSTERLAWLETLERQTSMITLSRVLGASSSGHS